jgi:hypothetical protein
MALKAVSTLANKTALIRGTMNEEGKRELKIFLEFWLLIGLLAAFNFYNYVHNGSKLFLVVGIICVVGFIGWALFYLLYMRKTEK